MSSDGIARPLASEPRPVILSTIPGGATTKARGYADGYAHGWAAGVAAAAERVEQESRARDALAEAARLEFADRLELALNTLASAASAAARRLAPVIEESRELLIAGSVEIAEAVIGAELSDHGVAVRAALGRALAIDAHERVVRVRLHPADLAALHETGSLVAGAMHVPDDVELVADPALGPGDAVSELPEGLLDARIDEAIGRVRHELELATAQGGDEA